MPNLPTIEKNSSPHLKTAYLELRESLEVLGFEAHVQNRKEGELETEDLDSENWYRLFSLDVTKNEYFFISIKRSWYDQIIKFEFNNQRGTMASLEFRHITPENIPFIRESLTNFVDGCSKNVGAFTSEK